MKRPHFLVGSMTSSVVFLGAFLGTLSGAPCSAQTTCPQSTGPDVIVGDVSDIDNVVSVGGLDAVSLGTTSCNVGTAPVLWQSNTPNHPVIGGALYRYHVVNGSGRFEQIGQSWLKHGFFALSGSLCCSCGGGGGSQLGVGCSDPYGAGLNGSQGGLGPRYQVNAHTGLFTYPPANPAWSGNLARRLQFETSEIDTGPSARYMGECMYVTADDAAVSGATHRMELAIRNWPVLEPGVTLTDVQVPGDGHFVVGSKATDLGGGMWHYEYAVCNQNADRCGGWFTVPLPAGANIVQNIGFHDVAYRNGDGLGNVDVQGNDWVGTVVPGGISWECEALATNPNANANRWGTTYNFRFDANVPPEAGNVTLGLWKPGTPAWMNASAQVPAGGSPLISVFCAGDGSANSCPCANNATAGSGSGCKSSLGHGGLLGTSGTPSVSLDSLALVGSGMPDSSALYYQGSQAVNGGLGTAFGDGLRCVGGTVVRLGTEANAGSESHYPTGTNTPVSVHGSCAAGDVRFYQCWYRNAAAFCTSETFNYTNGVRVVWLP
jgi:hypothetical protein